MSYFYLDESIHDDGDFIIVACVYSQRDLNKDVRNIFKFKGVNPDEFEFKSNANYSKEPEKIEIRDELKTLMFLNGKIGVLIVPRSNRLNLGIESIKALKQFIDANNQIKKPIEIFIDQGLVASDRDAERVIKDLNFIDCKFHLQMDSKQNGGIQIADLCAHSCSIQLKEKMGLINKKVKAGENSGYDADMEMELGFELWADLRYSFFNKGFKRITNDPIGDSTFHVEPYGLYVSEHCDEKLSEFARNCFSEVYLGCIH